MLKRIAIGVTLLLMATAGFAANWETTCTEGLRTVSSRSGEGSALCRAAQVGETISIFALGMTPDQAVRVMDALGSGYRSQVPCTEALVTSGDCAGGDLGAAISFICALPGIRAGICDAEEEGDTINATCTVAHVLAGACDGGDIGTAIANPQAKRDYADQRLRQMLRDLVVKTEFAEAQRAVTKPEPPAVDEDAGLQR